MKISLSEQQSQVCAGEVSLLAKPVRTMRRLSLRQREVEPLLSRTAEPVHKPFFGRVAMTVRRTVRKGGFTLVEILIVVIILGILAAIVIPQFTSASQDARKSSLVSQLQTIKAQTELTRLQHLDKDSTVFVAGGAASVSPWVPGPWAELLIKTN